MSIWTTVEVDAWSRAFNYNDYLDLHSKAGCKGSPLSFDTYQSFCELFDIDYEDSLK